MRVLIALPFAVAACTSPAEPPPDCTTRAYRIDSIELPAKAGQGTALGFDLDGDGQVDNAFANAMSALISGNTDLHDWSGVATARLAGGGATWRLDVVACSDGTERFTLGDAPLTVLADPLGTFAPIAQTPVVGAAFSLVGTRDELDGTIGFAIPMPDERQDLVAPLAAYLTSELAAGTSPYAAACDANHDGTCSVDELLSTCDFDFGGCESLVSLMTTPDVVVDGTHALSFGVGIHARLEP